MKYKVWAKLSALFLIFTLDCRGGIDYTVIVAGSVRSLPAFKKALS